MNKVILGVAILLLSMQTIHADELADSLKNYCEKIKQCAKAQMSAEDMQGMPANMLAMMEQSLNSMCTGMVESYNKALKHHDLYQPALACYQSMAQQSCEVMQGTTPECDKFDKLVEKYKD